MKNNFQIILVVVFVGAAILGVLVFAGVIPIGGGDEPGNLGTVILWGTIKTGTISKALEDFNTANKSMVVKYIEKSPDTFDQDLLEALASGTGPDIFFLPDDLAYHYANKIIAIPHTTYPLATFKNTFAGAGEVFLSPTGVLAFPVVIDPLVMYYNRNMLDGSGVVRPPAYWDEMSEVVPLLTKKDDSGKIIKSAVALGHFSNVNHAKDILATLFMQKGNPIITVLNGVYQSAFSLAARRPDPSPALNFYTDFADPSQAVYSWNKSFANSQAVFSSENLAFYFGFASELKTLVNKNPNQNFFVASVPQERNANFKLTGARVTGLAILSSTKNFNGAFTAASLMSGSSFSSQLSAALGVPPARRDLLGKKPTDAFSPIFYDSALFGRSWLDPSPSETDDVFRVMVEGVLSNNTNAENAIRSAGTKLNLLLLR